MDYASLINTKATAGSIKRWVNYNDIDSEQVVEEAMSWINERLRVPAMRKIQTGTIASAAETLAFPTDFIEELWFGHVRQASGRIRGMKDFQIEEARTYSSTDGALESGLPSHYSLGGNPPTAIFNRKADQDYAYRLVYLGRLKLDSGDNTTNWVTAYEPRLMRCACVGFANEFLKREGEKEYWIKMALDHIAQTNARWEMQLKGADIEVIGG